MPQSIHDTAKLHNGCAMPWFGLGVWQAEEGREVQQAVIWALEAGYRSIDTAAIYQNEHGVGKAITEGKVPREDIFLTTKVWNNDQGYDSTMRAFQESLDRLGMDYVDLYLIHWPVTGKYKETWRALETLYEEGRAKAIGVSNFLVHHLEDLLADAKITPMVNQVEFHPRLQQPELLAFDQKHGIIHEAWSPIMRGEVHGIPELQQIGEKYGKTPVQVTLRWEIQKGVVTIPKSVNQDRIQSNADIFDFKLTDDDMAVIDGLDQGERLGEHPDNF